MTSIYRAKWGIHGNTEKSPDLRERYRESCNRLQSVHDSDDDGDDDGSMAMAMVMVMTMTTTMTMTRMVMMMMMMMMMLMMMMMMLAARASPVLNFHVLSEASRWSRCFSKAILTQQLQLLSLPVDVLDIAVSRVGISANPLGVWGVSLEPDEHHILPRWEHLGAQLPP